MHLVRTQRNKKIEENLGRIDHACGAFASEEYNQDNNPKSSHSSTTDYHKTSWQMCRQTSTILRERFAENLTEVGSSRKKIGPKSPEQEWKFL